MLPPKEMSFQIRVEVDITQVYKLIQKALQGYKEEKRGPTLLAIQSSRDVSQLANQISSLNDFPVAEIYVQVIIF